MNYLTYSPSCEAYIAANDNGVIKYYDVTQDISGMSVTLNINDASTFTISLSNKLRKYDGLFQSMDRVRIVSTKTERYALMTGYITDVTALQMYAGDIQIRGKCPIYRLQQTFWDPGLIASQELMGIGYSGFDMNGYVDVVYNLLMQVGGYNEENIMIGDMPQSVVDFAREVYSSQSGGLEQTESMLKAFDDVLSTHGPKFSAPPAAAGGTPGGASDLGGGGTGDITLPDGCGTWATREFDLRADRVTTGMTSPYGFGLDTVQRRVQDAWIADGAKHDDKGFCKLQGKYLVATTSVFGEIGTWTTFYFSNGTSIETIKIDSKAEEVCAWDPNPANKWGHMDGQVVLEFCGEDRIGDNPYITLGLSNVTVTSATVHGKVC